MAKAVDKVQQGIETRQMFPKRWEDGDGIKDATKVNQWHDEEVIKHRQGVEGIGVNGRNQAELGE